MEYQGNIYALETGEKKSVTINSGNPFKVNYDGHVKNVLILAPVNTNSKIVIDLIRRLPNEEAYKVVLDTNKKPNLLSYVRENVDIVIDSHKHKSGDEEARSRFIFGDSQYIGNEELKNSDYETVLSKINKKQSRRNLETFVSLGEAI